MNPSDPATSPSGISAIDRTTSRIGGWAGWLLLLMVALSALNAILGKLGQAFHQQLTSNLLLELQWYLFGAVFLLGGAYTLLRDGHVHVDVFAERMKPRFRLKWRITCHLVLLLPFCLFLLAMCVQPVAQSIAGWEQSPDPDGLPRWIIKAFLPAGFLLLLLQSVSLLVRDLRRLKALPAGESD